MSSLQSFINNTLNEQQIQYKRVLDPKNKSELKKIFEMLGIVV